MKYIEDLAKVSNDELSFSEELIIVKDYIDKSKNKYRQIVSFIKNLNKYCEEYEQNNHSVNNDYLLFNTNNFCMYMLQRIINKYYEDYLLHKEVMEEYLHVNKLDSFILEKLNNQLVDNIFLIMTSGFKMSTEYNFELMGKEDDELFRFYNIFLSDMKLGIVNKLIGLKPIVFVGRKGYDSAIIEGTNILLLELNKSVKFVDGRPDVEYVYGYLINNIIGCSMFILFNDILTEQQITNLIIKYKLPKDDLSFKVGQGLAWYISGDKDEEDELFNEVLYMATINQTKEGKFRKKEIEIQENVKAKSRYV